MTGTPKNEMSDHSTRFCQLCFKPPLMPGNGWYTTATQDEDEGGDGRRGGEGGRRGRTDVDEPEDAEEAALEGGEQVNLRPRNPLVPFVELACTAPIVPTLSTFTSRVCVRGGGVCVGGGGALGWRKRHCTRSQSWQSSSPATPTNVSLRKKPPPIVRYTCPPDMRERRQSGERLGGRWVLTRRSVHPRGYARAIPA